MIKSMNESQFIRNANVNEYEQHVNVVITSKTEKINKTLHCKP